jgi:hypothetical protein
LTQSGLSPQPKNPNHWTNLTTSLYRLLSEPRNKDCLGALANRFGAFSDVVGYSALGDIFLRDPDTSNYVVVYLNRHGLPAKKYGPYDSVDQFRSEVLEDSALSEYCLKPESVGKLRDRVGSLEDSEVYFPQPFPCLGGSGELSTYSKGNVWIYVDLVGQSVE